MKKPSLVNARVGDTLPGGGPTPQALAHVFATVAEVPIAEVHSIEPWMIAETKPNMESTAAQSLMREGFEAWYPTYRKFSQMPRRMISSKTRHKKRNMVITRVLPLFPRYVLLRRLWGSFDLYRLFDLAGCGGLAVDVDHETGMARPLLLADHRIELMRLREADGLDDVYDSISPHAVMTGVVKDDPRFMKQWSSKGRILGRLDDSVQTSLFIEQHGRVVRIISSSSDARALGLVGATPSAKLEE